MKQIQALYNKKIYPRLAMDSKPAFIQRLWFKVLIQLVIIKPLLWKAVVSCPASLDPLEDRPGIMN